MPRSHLLSAREVQRLRAFRGAAGEVHEAYQLVANHKFTLTFFRKGRPPIDAKLITKPRFRTLAFAVRLCYLQKERAHFPRVADLVIGSARGDTKELANSVREAWTHTLTHTFVLRIAKPALSFNPQSLYDDWLGGRSAHQEEARRGRLTALKPLDRAGTFVLQMTVKRLAECILALDSLVAELLGEPKPPLPRHRRAVSALEF